MKNLFKLTTVLAVCAIVAFSTTSCGDKETCYECELNGTTETFCEGDDDGNGNELTEEQLEASVVLLESFGGYDCSKK